MKCRHFLILHLLYLPLLYSASLQKTESFEIQRKRDEQRERQLREAFQIAQEQALLERLGRMTSAG